MNPVLIKRLKLLAILFVTATVAYIFILISRPSISVTVEGEHNPLQTKILVDGKALFPSGSGGATYNTRVWPGKHTLTVRGPFVEPQTQETSVMFFGSAKLKIESKIKSPETIAREVLGDPDAKITGLRTFGNSIIFSSIDSKDVNEEGESSHPIALVYDEASGEWKNLSVVDVSKKIKEVNIPEAGVEYLYGLDNE